MGEEFTASEKKALLVSLKEMVRALERQETMIKEVKLWTRLAATEEARKYFQKVLDTDKKKWVYEALDGKATQAMIQQKTGVDQTTISKWGQEWEALGIVVNVGGGNRRKIIPLSALDIEVPSLPRKKS